LTEAPPARIFKEMRHREEEIEAFPSPPTQFSKEITKATKGSDIFGHKLRALRFLRG
jgi:hypothetical protein